MKESDRTDKNIFLSEFSVSPSVTLLKNTFSEIMGGRGIMQCAFFNSEYRALENKMRRLSHIAGFLKDIKRRDGKDMQIFKCACNEYCLFLPVRQGDNIYGYMLMIHLKNAPDEKVLAFLKLSMDIALKEFQKEQELTKLYDTIRPRAIALSTIHTIHRLLSSTLDMDELIERIARLTSQVMRARYCSIFFLDDSKKYLIAKAVVTVKNHSGRRNHRHKKIRMGHGLEGKVAKTGKSSLTHNTICVPLVEEDTIGVICAKHKTNKAPFNKFDLEILLTLAEQAVIAIRNSQLYEEQKRMAYGSIKSLAMLLDTKSPNIYTHSEKFVKIVIAIADEMALPREEIKNLQYAALLPDTGRFTIPDEILKKRGGLSKEEYRVIQKQHLESLKILEPLEFLKPSMPIIIHHHERYDGTGYPSGLKGGQIPIGARIMAVADAFEAMVSSRPHKDAKISIVEALKEIEKNKGTQFDPDVVDAFMAISERPEFRAYLNF